ncbi:MAG: metallophosphoesterase, partial [Spirochaetales bacterium]|nr:metallophosphoesterase [Spirochaetales bacterium]
MTKIAHITDMHLDDEMSEYYKTDTFKNAQNIIEDLIKRNIKYVIFTGDNGKPDKFTKILQILQKNNINFYITLGNHDNFNSDLIDLKQFHAQNEFYQFLMIQS